ncbi:type II toxin-antitoxin system HicB family antitoxin [Nostoc sp. C117]|uniref:type II toxin-antitoxin system HicB family antitoxin n=1 Tax=Nostoc sp. C117 TaxID=3349875 RepID=UPI00370D05DB
MKSLQDYITVIRPDNNGTFVAHTPAISGCHAWGQTPDEARAELVYVFEMIQEEYKEYRRRF